MDVEIKLQQALEISRKAFIGNISQLNEEMGSDQAKLFQDVGQKVGEFKIKLLEELNKEKEDFQRRYDLVEDDTILTRDYEHMPAKEEIIDFLIEGDNKDAVDELIGSFIEKLESKLGEEDSSISRLRKQE